jgi:hypothetical protein
MDIEWLKYLLKWSLVIFAVCLITGITVELVVELCPISLMVNGIQIGWVVGYAIGSLPVDVFMVYCLLRWEAHSLWNNAGYQYHTLSFPTEERRIELIAEAFPADRIRENEEQADILRAKYESRRP